MIPLTIPALQEHLKALKLDPIFQQETNQLIVIFKIDGYDFPLFFRIFEGAQLLQLITFIPCNLKASAAPSLARLLHLINKEIDLPGFGMDEKASIVYYRMMLTAVNGEIDGKVLETISSTLKTLCETFGPVISAVASGAASYEDVLKKLESQPK